LRRIIINLDELKLEDQKDSMIQAAFNQGLVNFKANGIIIEKLLKIQRCNIYSNDFTIKGIIPILKQTEKVKIGEFLENLTPFGVSLDISSKDQENLAVSFANQGISFIVCKSTDWKVIPFENLIAQFNSLDCEIYADVGSSLKDAELLLHTLELGVDGLIFSPNSENDLIELKKLLKTSQLLKLESATIKKINPIPEADRVCVDT